MFKVNNKDTRRTPISSISIADFKQVNVYWANTTNNILYNKNNRRNFTKSDVYGKTWILKTTKWFSQF